MTIPEACQLVLQASAIGERGQICVLDMGQPVRIVDLARNLILLSGLRPDNIGMGHCDGTAGGDLLLEDRDDTSIRAEHIAKPNRNVPGVPILHSEQNKLSNALRRAHDIGWTDSLV